ncbi:hypothetical protein A4G18_02875 [Pasteurellaceae bacterium Pebbles2]|nr:hypothetical protein [Pasteurellaceae bacterium Pebbles2]
MKKIILIAFCSLMLSACGEKQYTVYDYLQDKPKLDKDLNDCISGKIKDFEFCEVVKSAYNEYDFFKDGLLSEDYLKKLGKK